MKQVTAPVKKPVKCCQMTAGTFCSAVIPVRSHKDFTVLLTGKIVISPTDIRIDVSNVTISQGILILLYIKYLYYYNITSPVKL